MIYMNVNYSTHDHAFMSLHSIAMGIIIIIIGSTALGGPWPPVFLRFHNNFFCGVRLLASQPTPSLEDQVSLFIWVITLDLSGMGGPTSSICYSQHSSRDHMTAQAPPLRQSSDTFGGGDSCGYHSDKTGVYAPAFQLAQCQQK